jgi:hypothetical protein
MPLLTTLRQGRHLWGGLLLGVMLALLPLRGWAEATMHLPAPAAPAAHAAADEAPMPPCHAAMAHEGDTPDESAFGCSLCSLCHGTALCLGEAGITHEAAASTAPAAAPQGHGPPALPLPERPPRA